MINDSDNNLGIAACGAVANYNAGEGAEPVRNWFEVICKSSVASMPILFPFADLSNALMKSH